MGVSEVERAGAAYERGDWAAAHAGWSTLPPQELSVHDLDRLASVAVLLGRHAEAIAALQQAVIRAEDEGDLPRAVHCCYRLAMTASAHGRPALAAGWSARADELAGSLDDDAVEHGWLAFLRMFRALDAGSFAEAADCADRALAAGRQLRDPDLVAIATCARGRLEMYAGRVPTGLGLLDASMVHVVAGETSAQVAGQVYCTAIEGCQEVGDLARVAEWTAALEQWCAQQPGLLAFTGQCAVHRGQLMRLRGDWPGALEELAQAARRYELEHAPHAIGLAAYEAGEVRRLRGEHAAAEASYDRAADHGHEPQPGLALLWMSLGRTAAARSAVARLLDEPSGPVQRARMLPAAVEVLLGCDEQPAAGELVDELDGLAADFGCAGLLAAAAAAHGATELARGDPAGALPYLRKARAAWAGLDCPYEAARVRVQLARALDSMGDHGSARVELEAARRTFTGLGAAPALREVGRMLAPDVLPAGLTAREAEVLRLVAAGHSNAQIAGSLVLSEKTVARHLSNIFAKLDVSSRTAAAAFAFEHELVQGSSTRT